MTSFRHSKPLALATTVALVAALCLPTGALAAVRHARPKADVRTSGVRAQAVYAEDSYESDDTTAQAKVLPAWSSHTMFKTGGVDDHDWFKFTAKAGETWDLEALSGTGDQNIDTVLTVYSVLPSGETTPLAECDDCWFDTYDSAFTFTAPADGTYYGEIAPYGGGMWGSYQLHVAKGIGRRISASDRYATSAAISRRLFTSADNRDFGTPQLSGIVVANGASFADAMAGGPLAAAMEGPLLLTSGNSLSPSTAAEISRLLVQGFWQGRRIPVYILGGTGSVSAKVESQIKAITEVGSVVRIAGTDRYSTAAAVAAALDGGLQPTSVRTSQLGGTAYVVSGTAWPDALAAGAVAAYKNDPVLLSTGSSIPASTTAAIQDLGITDVVVVGGTNAVSPAAYSAIASIVGSENTTRVAGTDRYDTARAIAQWGIDHEGMSGYSMTLCSGENFPDALSAAVMSYWTESPLLLTPRATLSPSVTRFMDANGTGTPNTYDHMAPSLQGQPSWCVGGASAISDAAYQAWVSYIPKSQK